LRAVRLLGNGVSDVADVPDPVRKANEILIKVHASALCGSENKSYLADGKNMPGGYKLAGHEMAGEVADPGESALFKAGDRVVVQIMNGCGSCYYCQRGTYQFCAALEYLGGTHAQYVSFPEKCVIKAPDDIPYDTLVLLGGDTLGVAKRAIRQLDVCAGKTVFVSGAGPIGLGMTAMLKHLGCRVVVSEPSAYRREYIIKNAGADFALDPASDDVKSRLFELTDGVGPETVVECSGNPGAQLQALEYARCGGAVMFCGENYNGLEIIPSVHIIHKELSVKGAFYFTADDFYEIVGLYHNGLDVSPLASHAVKLDDAPEMLALFAKGLTGKVILHPQE